MKPSYESVRQVLRDFGPMTSGGVASVLQGSRIADVSSILNRMRKLAVKQTYILRYTYESDVGGRLYPRAVYALGNKRCAKKPPRVGDAERSRIRREREQERREQRQRLTTRVPNSVFTFHRAIEP